MFWWFSKYGKSVSWTLPLAPPADDCGCARAHLHAAASRENIASADMSHLKVLRGNFAKILNYPTKNYTKTKLNRNVSLTHSRCLATKTAPVVECKYLTSPWGEIDVGKETLTDFVFRDIELWEDKPSVVSYFMFITYICSFLVFYSFSFIRGKLKVVEILWQVT